MAAWDFKSTPIVIISRDRLEPLQLLLGWLDQAGYSRPIVVDNASTFPPLVDFLDAQSEIEVVRLDRNLGHLAPWVSDDVQSRLKPTQPFVATDCDVVPDSDCPIDVVEHLAGLLVSYKNVDKVGLGLRIDDLPDSYALKEAVIAWESRFWEREFQPGVFDAEVDTTFALYRSPVDPHSTIRALRTGPPYVARHLSWYADSGSLTEEQQYYREHVDPALSHWEANSTSGELQALLQLRSDEVATRKVVLEEDNPLLRPWLEEPEMEDERNFTTWARPGWHAWNAMSPEREFCDFVAALVRLIEPTAVVETGVGQGFVTRRVAECLGEGQQLSAFEQDPDFRKELERLPFFAAPGRSIGAEPSSKDFEGADLTVLDSELPSRLSELDRWVKSAPAGALVLIHDAGNGHDVDTPHHLIRGRIEEHGLEGTFLKNPRGAFLGMKPAKEPELRAGLERELDEMRAMRLFPVVRAELRLRRAPWFIRARALLGR